MRATPPFLLRPLLTIPLGCHHVADGPPENEPDPELAAPPLYNFQG